MKCVILAGGMGDRMWPLSRRNYPKQFMNIRENRSLLQETVGRNLSLCDEIFIMGNENHNFIIEGQMDVFQGINYRVFYESSRRGTAFPLMMAAFTCNPSEIMLVLNSDHFVEGKTYQMEIMKATDLIKNGKMVAFGVQKQDFKKNYHYFFTDNQRLDDVRRFEDEESYRKSCENYYGRLLVNTGILLCRAGDLLHYVKSTAPDYYYSCRHIHEKLNICSRSIYIGNLADNLTSAIAEQVLYAEADYADRIVLEPQFKWSEVDSFDIFKDYSLYGYSRNIIKDKCENVTIINQDEKKLVVAGGIKNAYVVNTEDALYITDRDNVNDLKNIVESNSKSPFFNVGTTVYRPWGFRENLTKSDNYLVRKVVLFPGKSIEFHRHTTRGEQWSVVEGEITVCIDGSRRVLKRGQSDSVPQGVNHSIINETEKNAVFIETSISSGKQFDEGDLVFLNVNDIFPANSAKRNKDNGGLIKLSPAFKDYLWGGTRLRDVYGKKCDYDKIAESWELSAHKDGVSIVASGKYRGRTFSDYIKSIGKESLGWKAEGFDKFPMLIKFIDAKDDLSIQIHPDDEYALKNEGEYGKNEMWYVMDAPEGSYIYWGLRTEASKEEIRRRVEDGTILQVLNKVYVKKGDVIFVEAGTIHAIGKGLMICEIQQNSNSTYRLYDYDRKDKYGNKRELNIDKALAVINPVIKGELPPMEKIISFDGYKKQVMGSCKYFQCEKYIVDSRAEIPVDSSSFKSFIVLEGSGKISDENNVFDLKAGDSFFVPAGSKTISISGQCEILVTKI